MDGSTLINVFPDELDDHAESAGAVSSGILRQGSSTIRKAAAVMCTSAFHHDAALAQVISRLKELSQAAPSLLRCEFIEQKQDSEGPDPLEDMRAEAYKYATDSAFGSTLGGFGWISWGLGLITFCFPSECCRYAAKTQGPASQCAVHPCAALPPFLPLLAFLHFGKFAYDGGLDNYRTWVLLPFMMPLGIILGLYVQTFVQGAFFDIQ